jgi:hypothetical protein
MEMTRRNMLRSSSAVTLVAAGMAGGQLATCTGGKVVVDPAVLDLLQKAIAGSCSIIPAAAMMVDVIALVFPAVTVVAAVTDPILAQITKYVCGMFSAAGVTPGVPPKLGAALTAEVNGKAVEVHGFHVVGGKPTWF